jgi:thiol-disulfide isomerase/thioredoxin
LKKEVDMRSFSVFVLFLFFANLSATNLLYESFEGTFPPQGWAIVDGGTQVGDSWEQTDEKKRTGAYSAAVFYGPQGIWQSEWLITPPLDFSGLSEIYLIFYEDENYWSGYGDHHYIKVSTTSQTDTTTFVTVMSMTPQNHSISGFSGDPVIVDLSSFAGENTVYIAFQYIGNWADDWFIDDISVWTPSNHDVTVTRLISPMRFVNPDSQYNVEVEVANIGLNPESFDVVLKITSDGGPDFTDTVSIDNLQPGDTVATSFSTWTPYPDYIHELTVYTALSGDEDPSNDTLVTNIYAYSAIRMPLLELMTNTSCPPCKPANDTLDHIMEDYGDSICLIRYHAWWPSSSDPFYQANIPENTARIYYYGADYVPHLWIDGVIDAGAERDEWREMVLNELRGTRSPVIIELECTYDSLDNTGIVIATLNGTGQMDPQDLRLRYAIIENNLYFPSPNGEVWHHQTFRDMFPDVNGVPVTLNMGSIIVDTQSFVIDTSWDWRNCEIVVFLQDDADHQVYQSARISLLEVNIEEVSPEGKNITLSLSPVPARREVEFLLVLPKRGKVDFKIYDITGRLVIPLFDGVLKEGRHVIRWNLRDMMGRKVGAGIYFFHIKAGNWKKRGKIVVLN